MHKNATCLPYFSSNKLSRKDTILPDLKTKLKGWYKTYIAIELYPVAIKDLRTKPKALSWYPKIDFLAYNH